MKFFKIFRDKIPKNIVFENNEKSNLSQLRLAKPSYISGNSHLEAACFGITIIIKNNIM